MAAAQVFYSFGEKIDLSTVSGEKIFLPFAQLRERLFEKRVRERRRRERGFVLASVPSCQWQEEAQEEQKGRRRRRGRQSLSIACSLSSGHHAQPPQMSRREYGTPSRRALYSRRGKERVQRERGSG